jgi:hypothetical protein
MNGGNMNFRRLHIKRLVLFLLIAGITGMMSVFYPCETSTAGDSSSAIVGCATQSDKGYDRGFTATDFSFINVGVDDKTNQIKLNTGNQALDINNIVVPFDQEVAVTFVYENAGYELTRFGWMFATDVDSSGNPITSKIRWIYSNINDNNNNGILDVDAGNSTNRWNDRNNDGVINARDNKEVLGYFKGGTELVFVLDSSLNNNSSYRPGESRGAVLYSKKAWNPVATLNPGGIQRMVQFYNDSSTSTVQQMECEKYDRTDKNKGCETGCAGTGQHICNTQGWLDANARSRLRTVFGLNFDAVVTGNTKCIDDPYNTPSQAMIVAAPAQNPNAWIIAADDQRHSSGSTSDNDFNDLVFLIERKTGGTAQLNPDKTVGGTLTGNAIKPDDPDAFFTGVTMSVFDDMPCAGKTNITYSVSSDNGATWIDITSWDIVRQSDDKQSTTGAVVNNWKPGTPEYTYRTARIDFSSSGKLGRQFLWKAQMMSDLETCVPIILNVKFSFTVAKHGFFARSAPVTQVNMIYAGSYETPEITWPDLYLRGHLIANTLYDPADPTTSAVTQPWDAGAQLNSMSVDARKIYFPRVDTISVAAKEFKKGDGTLKTFTDKIPNTPIQDGSVVITDGSEKFTDSNGTLIGDSGGSGTLDRFTGEFTVNFKYTPYAGASITLAYSYYKSYAAMKEFKPGNVTVTDLGLTDNWYWGSSGKLYENDFNNSCAGADNCVIDQNDADWLVYWIRGYKNGSGKTKKSWLLGPIDHSTPAIDIAPGKPGWYYGSGITDAERKVYDTFAKDHIDKRAVAYVGSRDGMLHAFDAGLFRWGDNPKTDFKETVGYFEWSGGTSASADYGTGNELWAFIPVNLISRLKNNYMGKPDPAYVDASPTVADVFINNYGTDKWTSVLMSAEGDGGNTVFCLDVTTPNAPLFLWEYSHPDLYKSKSSPTVAKVGKIKVGGESKWVAFFVSGKSDPAVNPSIYVLDIGSGSLLMQIFLTDSAIGNAGKGGVPSGQPAVIDFDGDGYVDRLYIGTDKGYLYKVNIPGDGSVTTCALNGSGSHLPIFGTPAVLVDKTFDDDGNETDKVRIFYGTGDSPYKSNDMSTSTVYTFYAYEDTDGNGLCTPLTSPTWSYTLPAGEKVWTSAFAAAGRIYFGTTTNDTEDPCEGTGKTTTGAHLYVFDQNSTTTTPDPLYSISTPNLSIPPLVDDSHLYIRDAGGSITSYGGAYNQPKIPPPFGATPKVKTWREVY